MADDHRRREVALACRLLAHQGLAADILGHVSVRVGPERMLVRCRGAEERGLLFTDPDDVHRVDLDGHGELGSWSVPNELPIHGELLRARDDVDAVVHCHPPAVLAAGLAGITLRPVFGAYNIPAARLALDGIPVFPRAVLIRRPALGRAMVTAMGDAAVVVLRGHGVTTVGSGPHAIAQAVVRAHALEALARVHLQLAAVGVHAPDLTDADIADLPDLGGGFNDVTMWRHLVARLEQAGLGI